MYDLFVAREAMPRRLITREFDFARETEHIVSVVYGVDITETAIGLEEGTVVVYARSDYDNFVITFEPMYGDFSVVVYAADDIPPDYEYDWEEVVKYAY